MPLVKCKNCQCWDRENIDDIHGIEGDTIGLIIDHSADCLRHPPQVMMKKSGHDETLYPVTFEEDGCFDGIELDGTDRSMLNEDRPI